MGPLICGKRDAKEGRNTIQAQCQAGDGWQHQFYLSWMAGERDMVQKLLLSYIELLGNESLFSSQIAQHIREKKDRGITTVRPYQAPSMGTRL